MGHEITIRFTGGILRLAVWLEGIRIRNFRWEGQELIRHLNHFSIQGPLDLAMKARGFHGTPWKIIVEVDGVQVAEYEGQIQNGISFLREEILPA